MVYKSIHIPSNFESLIRYALKKNTGFIIGVFVFNYLSIAWSLWQIKQYMVMLLDGILLLAGTLLLTLLLEAIPLPAIKKLFSNAFFYISSFLCLGEIFSIYNYNAVVGPGIVTAMLETNSREANEFFKMYVGWSWIIYILLFFIIAFLLKKNIFYKNFLISPRSKHNCTLWGIFSAGLISGAVIIFSYHSFIKSNLLDIPIVRVYAAAQTAVSNMETYKKLNQEFTFTNDIVQNNSTIPNIVFILGEATNRNHMHLYGYYLPNTPNLDAMKKENNIAVFTDCISPHSTTVAVLRDLFTFCDYESKKPWYKYNNLIDVMKAAGYKTYWLSNQESSGVWGNVALLYANHSNIHEFTTMRDSHEAATKFDSALFPLLDKAMLHSAPKNFYVLHLMGGHSLYYKRFPYVFSKFNKNDIHKNVSDEKKIVLAQYTNALYYNDYIVSSIIDRFKKLNAIVIYLPDHGETVYDDGSNFAGHVEENPNHYMLEVPMIIWASNKFKQTYPQKWTAIEQSVNRPYMTDDMIHTVLNIADIKTKEYVPSKSIINPAFDALRLRMVQGRNYDTTIRFEPAR
ncbi:phosphoethanolamine transferase [Pectinatus sottacetonis]|uniref:phosphoethanolamine transferase n=1 Tax=Pectinatus sottacetonis TaxID=1002795 RepID=UPI0018C7EB1D|nr:phosphoethanolamine transferase [Pectinatus sottacetonis]